MAIEHHFNGHTAMYDSIRAASLTQFRSDIDCGDAACLRLDRAELHRQAHSLKGVLLLLGATAASVHARRLEAAAVDLARAGALDTRALLPLWQALRTAVLALS